MAAEVTAVVKVALAASPSSVVTSTTVGGDDTSKQAVARERLKKLLLQ